MRRFPPPCCAALCAAAVAACKAPPPPAPVVPAPERPAERAAPVAPVAPGRSDEHCVAPLDAPGASVSLRKHSGKLVLGVVAGLKDDSEDNLAHLRSLVGSLRKLGAEVLIADGDLGDTSEGQEMLLSVLAQSGAPVLVVAGNREIRTDLDAAEESVRKAGGTVIDLSHTRVVDLGDALVVGLPGAFDRRQIRADGACIYVQRDLDALQGWLSRLPAAAPPVVLVAAVPPKGPDARALDFSDGQNLGDARLSALLQSRRAPFGIFGQVWEAGGRAIDLGGRPVPPQVPVEQLLLNPGAAEHTAWPMNDGATSYGQAALLTIEGRRASYQVVRLPPPASAQGGRSG
jgi:hypothetical protein